MMQRGSKVIVSDRYPGEAKWIGVTGIIKFIHPEDNGGSSAVIVSDEALHMAHGNELSFPIGYLDEVNEPYFPGQKLLVEATVINVDKQGYATISLPGGIYSLCNIGIVIEPNDQTIHRSHDHD